MGGDDPNVDTSRFGRYLRRVREDRKLSLDAVEEMTVTYPDRVTKSHLSRIENGSAVPSFGKMFALSQIYGIPIAAMAERFEMDLVRDLVPVEVELRHPEAILGQLDKLKMSGDYAAGLALLAATTEQLRVAGRTDESLARQLKIYEVDFLAHLGRYELAKVRCEQLLSNRSLSGKPRLQALMTFIICCYRLKRYTIAEMAIAQVDRELPETERRTKLGATFTSVRAVVQTSLGLYDQAVDTYKAAITLHREASDPFEACKAQLNLAQTLITAGRGESSLGYLRAALKVAEEAGYDKLKSLALSHLGVISFGKGDLAAAESYALRSNVIARSREYLTLVFRNCFYLRAIAVKRDDAASASQNERTLRSYLNRVEPDLQEAIEFRAELAGGQR